MSNIEVPSPVGSPSLPEIEAVVQRIVDTAVENLKKELQPIISAALREQNVLIGLEVSNIRDVITSETLKEVRQKIKEVRG